MSFIFTVAQRLLIKQTIPVFGEHVVTVSRPPAGSGSLTHSHRPRDTNMDRMEDQSFCCKLLITILSFKSVSKYSS